MKTSIKGFYGMILAGGVGTRFWPLSRVSTPKQLLKVAGEESLLMSTVKRLKHLMPLEHIAVVTNPAQAELMRLHLKFDKEPLLTGFVLEPFGRNTAPAIGLAAVEVVKKDPEAVMAVLPADHLIGNNDGFCSTLRAAYEVALDGRLVTIGIKPGSPETGYGYIKTSGKKASKIDKIKVRGVEKFVEKPDLKKAKKYLKDGGYFWNSGIFVWKASAILDEMRRHLPLVYKNLMAIKNGEDIEKAYASMESISIDYGVLEKSANVSMVEAAFEWSDIGSWSSLEDVYDTDKDGNIIKGTVVDIGSKNSFIIGSDRLVATIGLDDIILVDTPDATLVCRKDRAQEVKDVVDILKKKGHAEHETHVTVERPWGAYTVLEEGDLYKIKKIVVMPGMRLSLQSHAKRSEHWVVVAGEARVTRGKEVLTVKTNESTFIPLGVKHRLENTSLNVSLEIIEVQNGTYVGEDDITRYDDDFERR
ncbi:MAG: mannose-1-phosphate guanylyltransferase/mannose-6-phosphate isomerase [Deltaproteobacteria bacterium]|nr:mannose-1-phosphate guanylyltransferase/mannose-6-phosphate isomerase [Deltaproteobacteria bacterium]